MNPTGPDPDVAAELAARAGCAIADSQQLLDGSWSHRIECRDHRAKVRFLALLAAHDARIPDVRRLAELVVAGARNTAEQAERLQRFVQDRVTFTGEPDETFTSTLRTLAHGLGDCDDSSRALAALLMALGIKTKLATLPDKGTPLHVAPKALIEGAWKWLEPSINAQLGEHPLHAAKRLGIKTRPELGALNPDEGAQQGLHLTNIQWAAVGISTVAALGAMQAHPRSVIVPAATATIGASLGYAFTAWPLLAKFKLDDGYECSTWLPSAEEPDKVAPCNERYEYLRRRNAAIGAAAGLVAGLARRVM